MDVYGELKRAQLEHLTVAPTGLSGRQYLKLGGNNPEPTIYMDSIIFGPLDYKIKTDRDDYFYDMSNAGPPIAYNQCLSHVLRLDVNYALSNDAPRNPDTYTLRLYAGNVTSRGARAIFHGEYELMGESYVPFFVPDQTRLYQFRYDSSNPQPALSGHGVVTAPNTALAGAANHCAIHPSGKFIAFANDSSPYLTIYSYRNGVIGMKLADTASTAVAGNAQGVAFSPNGMFVGVAHTTTPFVTVYEFDPEGGRIGIKMANAATLPAAQGNGIAWSPDGLYVAVAHATSPRVSVYPWTAAGFGTKLADPATLPTGDGYAVAWKKGGTTTLAHYLAVAHDTTPFVSVYPITSGAFGTKATNPATLPAGSGRGVAFNPFSGHLAVAHTTSPYISVYPFETSFSAKLTDPGTLPGGNAEDCCWAPDGSHLIVGSATTTIRSYSISNLANPTLSALTLVSSPGTMPTTTATGVAISNCARYLAMSGSGASNRALSAQAPRPARKFFLLKSE